MARNKRLRAVIIAGSALAVVAAVGVGVAFASPSGRPRYVTAAATTGDVTQTYTTSGTVSRTNTATASFAVDGTVSSVKVAVGDTVDAGQTLAVLKKGPLQLAVLDAETSVAEAKATLYSAQHPSSTSRSSGSSGSAGAAASAASSGNGSSKSKTAVGVTIDPTALVKITQQLTAAVAAETKACEPVLGPVPTPSTSPSPTATPTPSDSPSRSEEPSASASASPEPSESASPKPSESPTAEASPSPSTTVKDQADVIENNDPTDAELKACGEARAQVQLTTNALQQTVQQLLKPSGSTPRPSGSSTSRSGGSSGSGSTSTTATVSKAQVASAEAKLLQAEQALQAAQDDLDNAELVAPISGTVGTVGLSTGASASSGSITIVGDGNARVTFELPLKTRALVKAGLKVSVTPAGSSKVLTGTLTGISAIETSGTAGDTPTYTTIVTVSDSGRLLASGARASVSIPVKTASKVVRVPVSAVTPTGSGTGTVQVVTSARAESASTVNVGTGAVGGGWIEITQGVNAGDLVVLADNTAALPTNSNGRRTTTTTTRATASASAAPGGGAAPDGGGQPSAAPSAAPSR